MLEYNSSIHYSGIVSAFGLVFFSNEDNIIYVFEKNTCTLPIHIPRKQLQ